MENFKQQLGIVEEAKDPSKTIPQLNHNLKHFTELANKFWEEGDLELYNYWKGQVMGMCKVISLTNINIDTDHWLKKLS